VLELFEVLSTEADGLASWKTVIVEAAQNGDLIPEPAVMVRILRDGISREVRDAGHAET